jgi:hypothetical protein
MIRDEQLLLREFHLQGDNEEEDRPYASECSPPPACSSRSATGPSGSIDQLELLTGGLRREPGVLVRDGTEVPVGERVVVDVEREVRLCRDLEVRALAAVAHAHDGFVLALFAYPEERDLDPVNR